MWMCFDFFAGIMRTTTNISLHHHHHVTLMRGTAMFA